MVAEVAEVVSSVKRAHFIGGRALALRELSHSCLGAVGSDLHRRGTWTAHKIKFCLAEVGFSSLTVAHINQSSQIQLHGTDDCPASEQPECSSLCLASASLAACLA